MQTQENNPCELSFTREVAASAEWLYRGWTDPTLLPQWFCPKPWRVSACALDPKPGGAFNTTMCSPDGDEHPMQGCYLEVVPNRRIVFTDSFTAGYRPAETPFMTAIVSFEPTLSGTSYTATAMHKNEEDCKRHEEMGFYNGWNAALDQLLELIKDQA